METFHVTLTQVAGGARLGKESSVLVGIAPNDSPLGSFGFEALMVNWAIFHSPGCIDHPLSLFHSFSEPPQEKKITEEYLEILI